MGGGVASPRALLQRGTYFMSDYSDKNRLLKIYGSEVTAYEFYEDIFPDREVKGDVSSSGSNPIVTYLDYRDNDDPMNYWEETFEDGSTSIVHDMRTERRLQHKRLDGKDVKRFFRNEIVFAGDDGRATLDKCINNDFALCSLCSYYGRKKRSTNAYKLHGFCIDLDGVGEKQLMALWYYFTESEVMPMPTYLVNSGHGLHVYYIFEEPIPLYPQIRAWLRQLYKGLEIALYTRESTKLKPENIQGHLNIYQSFRMVGSYNAKSTKKLKLRAFKVWKRVTLEYLNKYVDRVYQIPILNDISEYGYMDEHKTLAECQEFYPEWYQRRIIDGLPTKQWICSRGLYDWWLDYIQQAPSIRAGARMGNRYYCIGFLYAYGIKCNISKEEVRADAESLFAFMKEFDTEENPFTVEDLKAAEDFYKPENARISIKYIEAKTGFHIERARRNGRTQAEHLQRIELLRGLAGYDNVGRHNVADTVIEWRKAHPDGKKADCIKETGLSKPTVYKWWNGSDNVKKAPAKKEYAPNSIELEMQEAGLTDAQIKRMLAYIQNGWKNPEKP